MKLKVLLAALVFLVLSGCSNYDAVQNYTVPAQKQITPIERQVENKKVEAAEKVQPVKQESDAPLSNDNTYINSQGNEVHSPAFAPSIPAGASALCRDGEYSFSQSRRGTCSHHGGVAEWY